MYGCDSTLDLRGLIAVLDGWHALHQHGRLHAQSTRQPADIDQAGVAVSPLDAPDIILVEVSKRTQRFLRKVAISAQAPKAAAEM